MREMTVEPKPCCEGALTGGPAALQLIRKVSFPVAPLLRLHPTSTRPSPAESALNVPALVASSRTARRIVWAAGAVGGPSNSIRLPIRTLKWASLQLNELNEVHASPFVLAWHRWK